MKRNIRILGFGTLAVSVLSVLTACGGNDDAQAQAAAMAAMQTPTLAVQTYTCECGDFYQQDGEPMKAHDYDADGKCKNCDATVTPTSYTINFKNNASWENVSIYMWEMNGEEAVLLTAAWPGVAMTKVDGTEDWYSYTFEAIISDPAAIKLIFNNGLAEGAMQTSDLIFSDTNLWWSNGVAYADKTAAENAKANSIVVYFRNTLGWEAPHAHAWNTSGAINSWPGVAMTKVDGTEDWYSYTIETASIDGLGYMFTDGVSDSNNKTADIAYDATKLYYSGGNSYATQEEAEADVKEYSDLYLRGSNNSWGTGDRLLLAEDGSSYITITLASGVQFKICDVSWSNAIDYTNATVSASTYFTAGTDNNNIMVVTAGTYTFNVDTAGNLTITKE